jgi:hypothetical protein
MVRWVGVEPTRLAAHGPQPCLSANSSTSAESNGIITVSTGLSSQLSAVTKSLLLIDSSAPSLVIISLVHGAGFSKNRRLC